MAINMSNKEKVNGVSVNKGQKITGVHNRACFGYDNRRFYCILFFIFLLAKPTNVL